MSIYHLNAQIIGRTAGRSACAAAAYRATSKITDRTTGEVFDFTRKKKALESAVIVPAYAPDWARNREELWNSVQEKENRKNSQFARELNIAIPYELRDNGSALIRAFCEMNFTLRGLISDYAIHAPDRMGDQRNIHAHIMITTRAITKDGWGEKDREANDKNFLQELRRSWQEVCNAEFERIGSGERIDCRTLEEQGIERIAQRHQGVTATAMERKGKAVERTRKQTEAEYERRKKRVSREELDKAINADEEVRALKKTLEDEINARQRSRQIIQERNERLLTRTPEAMEEIAVKTAAPFEKPRAEPSIIEPKTAPKAPPKRLRDKLKDKIGELQEWFEEPILTEQVEYVRDKIGELKKRFEEPLFAPKARQTKNEKPPTETAKPEMEQQETPAPITEPEQPETQSADEQFKSLIEQADKANKLPWRKYHKAGEIPRLYDPINRIEFAGRNFIAALLHKELSNSQDARFFPQEVAERQPLKPNAEPVLLTFKERDKDGNDTLITRAYYNGAAFEKIHETPVLERKPQAGIIQAKKGKTAMEQLGKDLTAFLTAARTGKAFAPSPRHFPLQELSANRLAMAAHSADLNQRIVAKTEKERQNAQNRSRDNGGLEW